MTIPEGLHGIGAPARARVVGLDFINCVYNLFPFFPLFVVSELCARSWAGTHEHHLPVWFSPRREHNEGTVLSASQVKPQLLKVSSPPGERADPGRGEHSSLPGSTADLGGGQGRAPNTTDHWMEDMGRFRAHKKSHLGHCVSNAIRYLMQQMLLFLVYFQETEKTWSEYLRVAL